MSFLSNKVSKLLHLYSPSTLSTLHHPHTCSDSIASTTKPMAFALSHTLIYPSGTISPKTSGTLLLSLPSKAKDISLLQIFQWSNIVPHHYGIILRLNVHYDCVLCLFSTLSRKLGTLQISIIIITFVAKQQAEITAESVYINQIYFAWQTISSTLTMTLNVNI